MFDQLPKWLQQTTQDPPKKKKYDPFLGPLRELEEKLKALPGALVRDMKEMGRQAVEDPRTFMAGMIGPGELGAKAARPAIQRLLKELANKGGATLTAAGKKFAGSGYAVADPAFTLKTSDPAEMRAFLQRPDVTAALGQGKHIGKWTDPETGATEINLSDIFPDQAEARRIGGQRGEKAIGHLKEGAYQGDVSVVPPEVGQAAVRFYVPGETQPRLFTGRAHPFARLEAEDQLGDLLDANFEPRFKEEQGFLDVDGGWMTREEALESAKYHNQLTSDPKKAEAVKRSGQMKAEALLSNGSKRGFHTLRDEPVFDAPAVLPTDHWKPTERGVFDRSAPQLQGTAEPDPRLFGKMQRGVVSPLHQAISESPVVEGGLLDDALLGLPKGGDSWYELGPLKSFFEELGGPFKFEDWVNASGAGSIQNPTHNELASASALLFGKKRGGMPWDQIKQIQQQMHPQEKNLWLSSGIAENFNRADKAGLQLPSTPGAGERKVPWYSQGKQGGSRSGFPALDTHERRRILQLARQDPQLTGLLDEAGIPDDPMALLPLNNSLDYEAAGAPFQRIANMLDLPSTQAAQAGRWLGGGEHTGLASAPFGDYMQTLEDGLLYTARLRGLDESPAGLRKLAEQIFSGDEFFAPVYSRKGGFPGVTGH